MSYTPPNQSNPGNRAANGSVPLSKGGSPVNPPNGPSDHRAGTMPLSGSASPITPPNAAGGRSSGKMGQPPSAVSPGKGMIPVQAPSSTMKIADLAGMPRLRH